MPPGHSELTPCPVGVVAVISNVWISNTRLELVSWVFEEILPCSECQRILLLILISQHWFRKWLGAIRQQAITWTGVYQDLRPHISAAGHSELTQIRLTHWGRGKLKIIGSDNGLSPGRRQAIIWTDTRILSIRPLATNLNEISIGIQTFSLKKMYLKMSSAKWRPFCLGLNLLKEIHVCCFQCTLCHRRKLLKEDIINSVPPP